MKGSQKIKFIGSAVVSGICVLFFLISLICFAAGVFSLPKGSVERPDVPVIIPPPDPEIPEPPETVFGKYSADLYIYGKADVNLYEDLEYSIENEEGVIFAGLFEIIGLNRVLLYQEDGYSVDLTLSRPAYTAALTDITAGKALQASYTREITDGDSTSLYTLKLYKDAVFALLLSENGLGAYAAVYGHYYYNTDNVFVIRYLNLSEKLVLRADMTFISADEEVKGLLQGSYFFAASENGLGVLYELELLGGKSYIIYKRYSQGLTELPLLTETAHGVYTLEDDKLIVPYFGNARILLSLKTDPDDNTFAVTYNLHYGFDDKATGRKESYSLVLTLRPELDYGFVLTDLLNAGGALTRFIATGVVSAATLQKGFSVWNAETVSVGTDKKLAVWADITSDNPGFIFVNKLVYGRYKGMVNALDSELEINSDGTYKIKRTNIVLASGDYTVKDGFFKLGEFGYAKLNYDYTFSLAQEPVVEYEIELKNSFAVGEEIDFSGAFISLKTVSSSYSGALSEANFEGLSTAAPGNFAAKITYGSFSLDFFYTVIDREEDSPAYLVVEGLPSVIEKGVPIGEVIKNAYYYTVSKLGAHSATAPVLSTMIRKFSSASTGAFRMTVNAETFLFYHDYSVVLNGATPVSISVTGLQKLVYDVGDTPDYEGGVLHIVNALGTHEQKNLSDFIEDSAASCNLSTSAAGSFVAEIKYNDLTCYFSYTVKAPIAPSDAEELALGTPKTIEATNESAYDYAFKLSFTPTEGGDYIFSGTSEYNTQASLYNAAGKFIDENDNDPDNAATFDFKIKVTLEAGVTYILTPSFVATRYGSITVTVVKNG